jgi:hypothetical protein
MKDLKVIMASLAMLVVLSGVFTACKNQMDQNVNKDGDVNAAAIIQINPGGVRGSVFNLTTQTWTAGNTYVLNGFCRVPSGVTLTINAGAIVQGDKASAGTLIVERGGVINAVGTSTNPIVFTSEEPAPNKRPGDWGGVIICGNAPVNITGEGNAAVGGVSFPALPAGTNRIEGIIPGAPVNANPTIGTYGGSNAADNSGSFRFCRIEYAGINTTLNNETNGLTMGGVGSGTTIDHVEVAFGNDDAFEWFGGTVNCKYLFSYRNRDDDFDTDFGYKGRLQFLWALRDPAIADNDKPDFTGTTTIAGSGSNGFESDNNNSSTLAINTANPRTQPQVFNATITGPDNPSAANQPVGAQAAPITIGTTYSFGYVGYSGGGNGVLNRRNTLQGIHNAVLVGWPKAGYEYTVGTAAGSPAVTSLFSTAFTSNTVTTATGNVVSFRSPAIAPTPSAGPNRVCFNPSTLGFGTAGLLNLCRPASNLATDLNVLTSFWSLTAPNPRPNAGSVLLSGGVTPPAGFDNVTFRGAFTNAATGAGSFADATGWHIVTGTNWVRFFNFGQ